MSFWLSSHRFLSLNRALWEIPPPAMWPLCPPSYRTRRTVWSTVPLTREEAKREVKPRPPGAGYLHRMRRDGSLIQLKKKGSKEPKWIIYLPTGGSCWTFPFTSMFDSDWRWWWTFWNSSHQSGIWSAHYENHHLTSMGHWLQTSMEQEGQETKCVDRCAWFVSFSMDSCQRMKPMLCAPFCSNK